MSCYGCGSGFSFFNKEHGCKNCGFAFCSKCLTKKTVIEKLNNEKHHVCNKCFNILTGKIKPEESSSSKYSPPEAFKKRVAALKDREDHGGNKQQKHKPSHQATGGAKKPQYKGLNKSEREIAERLDKLKEKTPEQAAAAKVSEKEINERLAKLKGEDPAVRTAPTKPVYHPPERRTQQSQIDDLLNEIADEVEIDSHKPDPVAEVEGRLAQFRDQPSGGERANNLNRGNSQENKPFEMNIPGASGEDNSKSQSNDEISIEEMNKLIEQAAKEMEMDAHKALEDLQKDKEIMKKLQEIKSRKKEDVNKEGDEGKEENKEELSDSDNENEEELTKNLIKKLLEESKLDEAAAKDGVDVTATGSKNFVKQQNIDRVPSDQMIDDDELPYCCICTEDASIRCHGCDLDLYCSKCWKQSHTDFQMEDHETSKYKPPKDRT